MNTSKPKLFGGTCKITLATSSETWEEKFHGPGFLEEDMKNLRIHTECADACYDRECVVGYVIALREKPGKSKK